MDRLQYSGQLLQSLGSTRNRVAMKYPVFFLLTIIYFQGLSQGTDVSLFLNKDKQNYLTEIESNSGNLFNKLGHHGPAIENPWYGLRIYFNKKMAIDVYSKAKPGLELTTTKWYPTKDQQRKGWGADYYKVGNSLGLGGIRLWDGEKIVPLNPVNRRSAKVINEEGKAVMEVLSEGVPYKGKNIDVIVRVTTFADNRLSTVEAEIADGTSVQFITGINHHDGISVKKEAGFIATWGVHPEDVALEKVEVGAAIIFDKEDFLDQLEDKNQHLLISKPTHQLSIKISSCNARESELNSEAAFVKFLKEVL